MTVYSSYLSVYAKMTADIDMLINKSFYTFQLQQVRYIYRLSSICLSIYLSTDR